MFQKSATKLQPSFAAKDRELPRNKGLPWRRVAARELACNNGWGTEAWERLYYLQHLQHGTMAACLPRMAILCRVRQVHGVSAMAELAAAVVAKGAAETMEGVCRKGIICGKDRRCKAQAMRGDQQRSPRLSGTSTRHSPIWELMTVMGVWRPLRCQRCCRARGARSNT